MARPKPAYKRILLKLSGESLLGLYDYGIDLEITSSISREIKEVHDLGVQVAIMIGGGNIFRGVHGSKVGMDRATALISMAVMCLVSTPSFSRASWRAIPFMTVASNPM